MSVRERSRNTVISFPPYTWEGVKFGGGKIERPGIQFTESQGHRKTKGHYREGGPFFTYLIEPNIPSVHIDYVGKFDDRVYHGPAILDTSYFPSTLNAGGVVPSSDSKFLDPYGAEAISLVDPTNPNAQTGIALGEILKDRRLPIPGIPSWRRRTEVAKAAGSEYLNAVFGWLPLVSDMKDTAQSVLDGNTILENYSNASGTDVHREFAFDDIESFEETNLGLGFPTVAGGAGIGGDFVNRRGPVIKSTHTKTKRWFSGSFTYTAQSGGSSVSTCLGFGSDANKLFGIALTPDVVWELTPWSWAIDWFSNASNVIHNIGSLGPGTGLVMRYGYMMEEKTIVETYTMPDTGMITGLSVTIPPATRTITVKRRREANPFGFGLKWEGLSPTQLAITAALGITHLR